MGRDKENSGFNIESTNSNHGKKIMVQKCWILRLKPLIDIYIIYLQPIDRNEYGVNLKADPVILNPRKRKIDADAILEESVGKKTRLDDILENMKNISNVLKRSLEPNNTGYNLFDHNFHTSIHNSMLFLVDHCLHSLNRQVT